MTNFSKRKINYSLTERVKQLHSEGYVYDFAVDTGKTVFCLQSNSAIENSAFTVKLIDQIYDQLFMGYKYIHAIETDTGEKGILLSPEIYFQHKLLNLS
ncbi:hypothetical protein ACFFGT_02525 [Mucilaginibacter angelicae]|uniref:Uncharacterized protein n=1 Tax=Mucilaginibacter angelicae TaxID=869718 RepID=A0ABV6L369_9SPHI